LLWLATAQAAFGLTTITDTLYDARGKLVSGRITIKWDAFTVPGPRTVAAGQVAVAVRNGAFTVELEPGDTAQPAAVDYTAEYRLSDGLLKYERWRVPTSATPVTISAVRLSTVQTPATMLALTQLSPVGAAKGDLIAFGTSWGLLTGGTDGQALLRDSTQARGVKWGDVEAGVSSVFGRTGAVTAQSGDYAVAEVTGLTDALAGKAPTSHGHVMMSTAGAGHFWPWGAPLTTSVGWAVATAVANRVYYWEFEVPATITIRKVYARVFSSVAAQHLAIGLWDASGALMTNGNSNTITGETSAVYFGITFPGDVILGAGTYYLGVTTDSAAIYLEYLGTSGDFASELLLTGIYGLVGATSLRYNFSDGSVSTGTTTLVMPANMGAPSARVPRASGPYNMFFPLILVMP